MLTQNLLLPALFLVKLFIVGNSFEENLLENSSSCRLFSSIFCFTFSFILLFADEAELYLVAEKLIVKYSLSHLSLKCPRLINYLTFKHIGRIKCIY